MGSARIFDVWGQRGSTAKGVGAATGYRICDISLASIASWGLRGTAGWAGPRARGGSCPLPPASAARAEEGLCGV